MRFDRLPLARAAVAAAVATLWATAAFAVNVNYVSGATGRDIDLMRELVKPWEASTGNTVTIVPMPSSTTDQFAQYRLWLAAGNADIDVYQTDVIWAPQLADSFVDLTEAAADVVKDHFPSIIASQTVDGKLVALPIFTDAPALYYRKDLLDKYGEKVPTTWDELADSFVDLTEAAADVVKDHFPSIIASQTVDGKLVALPIFTDAPALYYRKDLLDKYGEKVPTTWDELAATAKKVQDGERAAGSKDIWGYVWQGSAYEGLTCNALEWLKSNGGGTIIDADGNITVNNPEAVKAVEMAASWVNTISPPGVLSYMEEESRGVWQTGNAVFMRNWPYAYALGNGGDSPIKGKFDVAPLPSGGGDNKSAATLGGWNVAVSKFSPNKDAAISLAKFMSSTEVQKQRALQNSQLPTIISLYDDPEIAQQQPLIPRWKDIFLNAVPRPSAQTKVAYNEVSNKFWSAVHETLGGTTPAGDSLELLEADLDEMKGGGW